MIGVAVLGSTGSIGESTLDVLGRHPDRFRVVALAARQNAAKLAQQVIQWQPQLAVLADEACIPELNERLARAGVTGTRVLGGQAGLIEVAAHPASEYVMAAIEPCGTSFVSMRSAPGTCTRLQTLLFDSLIDGLRGSIAATPLTSK